MTKQKHLKRLVRDRMAKTGERYAAARRQTLRQTPAVNSSDQPHHHFPGSVPASTALRILLANAGLRAPHTDEPFTEAMAFGIAGGVGAGVFAFRYEKEDFSSFFVAGRHRWEDDHAYLTAAAPRFGATSQIREIGGAKTAEAQLHGLLEEAAPVIAWVDMASLPYRGMPESWSGGGYHVIVVYEADGGSGLARVGDLTDEPITLALQELKRSRARIKKQKNRLLALTSVEPEIDLEAAVRAGLEACLDGLRSARSSSFSLEAFKNWASRMHGGAGKDDWARNFPAGKHLWTGLTSMYHFIEHYGTGGGLCRPIHADFLAEAAGALQDERLKALSDRYRALGRGWSALADAGLPDTIDLFRRVKQLHDRKAEVYASEGAAGSEKIASIWKELDGLQAQAEADFPLTERQTDSLREELKGRILDLHAAEAQALDAIGDYLGRGA